MTNLTKQLEKYYSRKGNRLIFSNGMTLNQLALEMWERLGYREIDASVLSRFLQGERLLNLRQFQIFCQILRINGQRRKEYTKLLNYKILSSIRQGENFEYLKQDLFVDRTIEAVDSLRNAMAYDAPLLALEMIDLLKEKLNNNRLLIKSNDVNKHLLILKGKLLLEEKVILLDVLPFNQISRRIIEIAREFKKLGEITGEKEFLGNSEALIGRTFFHYGNYLRALKHDLLALKLIKNIEEKCVVFMRLADEYAFLNIPKEFLRVRDEFIDTLFKGRDDMWCFSLKGISQANSLLGREKEARHYLDEAWQVYHTKLKKNYGKYKHIRKIQLNFAEYQFKKKFGSKSERQSNNFLSEINNLSSICGYKVYQIKKRFIPMVVL